MIYKQGSDEKAKGLYDCVLIYYDSPSRIATTHKAESRESSSLRVFQSFCPPHLGLRYFQRRAHGLGRLGRSQG